MAADSPAAPLPGVAHRQTDHGSRGRIWQGEGFSDGNAN